MKKLIIPLLFIGFYCKAELRLNINIEAQNDSSIILSIKSTNLRDYDSILFYTPDEKDICFSILNIDFINSNNGNIHEYFHCTMMTDIDHMVLQNGNLIILKPCDSYVFKIDIRNAHIAHHISFMDLTCDTRYTICDRRSRDRIPEPAKNPLHQHSHISHRSLHIAYHFFCKHDLAYLIEKNSKIAVI